MEGENSKNPDKKEEEDFMAFGPQTIAIHGGTEGKDSVHGPVNVPIYASSTFAYPSVQEGAKRFAGESDGFVYGRLGNPTLRDVETRLARLEGGEAALLLASGMAAVATLVFSIVKTGDHVIADHTLYGGTHSLFTHRLPELGIDVSFVDCSVVEEVEAAIRPTTKLIYFETLTNPTLRVVPIAPIVSLARAHDIFTAVDSTFMTPILQKPLEMGIDAVIHSATKYLNGHSDVIAGVIIGDAEFVGECRMTSVHYGGILGPFEAYLLGRGLKTLKLRMEEHEKNGRMMAEYLRNHPLVKNLNYLGFEENPEHERAKMQQHGFGSMITFELDGTLEMAMEFVNALDIATRAVSLGGVETLISHPASTTHSIVDPEDRLTAGISDTLIRLSVGIEDIEDLILDFEQAFNSIGEMLVEME
ncbi:MAG: trans-sulfuration enzyme family protein [Candidatus Kariarchaeaceae archaeon]|jgi:methionine-gamma-lyase